MLESTSDSEPLCLTPVGLPLELDATGLVPVSQRPMNQPPPFRTRMGTVLQDKYRIDALLGAGGCGRVYRATHTRLQGTVAVKFLLGGCNNNPVQRARFDREARLLARLSHPRIVVAHDYGEDAGELYLVMEYVTGRQLGVVLADYPYGMPINRIISILAQAQDALSAAHSCGIVHRDIKPSNIMLYEDDTGAERLKLLDFGIAFMKESQSQPRLTRDGQVIGTVNYMAPEQCLGREVGTAADIYSLGVVFYQMLSGRLPFTADSPADVMKQHIHCAPPPIDRTEGRCEIPPELFALVQWAMEKSPDARPNALLFRQALRRLVVGSDNKSIEALVSPAAPISQSLLPVSLPVSLPAGLPVGLLDRSVGPSRRPTVEAVVIQSGDSVTLPIIALWGLPGPRMQALGAALDRHRVRAVMWPAGPCPLPSLDSQPLSAVLLPDGPHALMWLRSLRTTTAYAKMPILVLDVVARSGVLPLIQAGASDMALPETDTEQLCHQTLRLIRRGR